MLMAFYNLNGWILIHGGSIRKMTSQYSQSVFPGPEKKLIHAKTTSDVNKSHNHNKSNHVQPITVLSWTYSCTPAAMLNAMCCSDPERNFMDFPRNWDILGA